MEVCQHSLVVLLNYLVRYPFHAKDLDVEAGTVWEGIFDGREVFFMNLIHVHVEP